MEGACPPACSHPWAPSGRSTVCTSAWRTQTLCANDTCNFSLYFRARKPQAQRKAKQTRSEGGQLEVFESHFKMVYLPTHLNKEAVHFVKASFMTVHGLLQPSTSGPGSRLLGYHRSHTHRTPFLLHFEWFHLDASLCVRVCVCACVWGRWWQPVTLLAAWERHPCIV